MQIANNSTYHESSYFKKYTLKDLKVLMIFLCLFFCGCSNHENIKKHAFVYKSDKVHIGNGNFKLLIYYKYEYNDIEYKGNSFSSHGRMYNKKMIEVGDSVLVLIRKDKPKKSKYIRLLFDKDFNEDLEIIEF